MQYRIHVARGFAVAAVGAALFVGAAAAAPEEQPQRLRTPAQFQGPYYPDALPRDTDNDLVRINENEKSAQGEVVHVIGRIVDANGSPIGNAQVELWQTDSNGIYLHTRSLNRSDYDQNFQGFGRTLTGPDGAYYFRTLRPASHIENRERRAPHFHFAVLVEGRPTLYTQLYLENEPLNDRDPILNSIADPAQRESVITPLAVDANAPNGALKVEFEIVLGVSQND